MSKAAMLIVALVVAAYWPALASPFLFDDQTSIVNNRTIRALTADALRPPADTPVAGRPIVNLTFAANYAADALNPRWYRLTNLAVHALAALILFATVRRIGGRDDLAFASALLWAVHPLNSEVVNYVTQRTEALMGLCYLLTVYFSVRSAQDQNPRWTAAAVGSCIAGMLCKESMVTAPLAVLLIDRTFLYQSWRQLLDARRSLYAGFAAAWAVLGAIVATAPRSSAGFGSGIGSWDYLLNQARMVTQYLKLAVWPRSLVLDYGVPQALTVSDVILPGVLVVALLAATVVALRYKPQLGALGAWFFLTLAPTSSVMPISTEVGAERRMYLPLIAIVVLVAIGLTRYIGQVTVRRAVIGILAAAMVGGVWLRNRDYASPLAMARTIVERWPNGRGHFTLGTLLIEAGQPQEGMAQLRLSARDYPGALYAIATEQLAAGQTTVAIETLRQFLTALPDHPTAAPARDMLARAYAAQGDLATAEAEARQLVTAAPQYVPGHDLLGRLLAGKGQFAAAAAEFQQVLRLDPANVEAQRNLATMQRLAAGVR